ncbi:MAG: helix-turn-helix transcriptional regulator [Ignavibacteria bacterium]|jgi:transcriptional regulator with XRE-family HTH domain
MLKKFAEDLKAYREKKKISLLHIANETRIHISNLEKIENGEFDFLPPPYIRAFLKQYIKSLGLDEKETLYNFDLAKSGKYQPLAENKEEKEDIPEIKEKISEEEIVEAKKKNGNSNGIEIVETLFEEKIPVVSPKPVKQKEKNKPVTNKLIKKIDVEKAVSFEEQPEIKKQPQKKSINISPSIFKSLGIVVVVLLMSYGIYLLVTTVFITGTSKSKLDIVRQNFDTVVKENEKKILGKRSKEEIEDSIKRVQFVQDSIKRTLNDSIKLDIKCLKKGYISVIVDSISYDNMYKESFDKDYKGTWKAKKYFWITSNNTNTFELFLNGNKLDIKDTKVRYLKISKDGIQKE